jgi:hypothetical protein
MASRRKGAVPAVALIIGIIGIFQLNEAHRLDAFRTVDVVQLVASGMCFGVTLMWVIQGIRDKTAA